MSPFLDTDIYAATGPRDDEAPVDRLAAEVESRNRVYVERDALRAELEALRAHLTKLRIRAGEVIGGKTHEAKLMAASLLALEVLAGETT